MSSRKVLILTTLLMVTLTLLGAVLPAQSSLTTGLWRLISPTEYTSTPDAELHGVFLTSGGTSGKGSGSGWAVGVKGFIFYWDGFSWNQASSPVAATCTLDGVSFGGPLNPLSSITSSSGWAVGGGAGCAGPVSVYYNGIGWTSYTVPGAAGAEVLGVNLVKSASSPSDSVNAFAVGVDGGIAAFWIWNGVPGSGGAWSETTISGQPQVNSVYMTHCSGSPCSGDDGIAVGNTGTIYRYVGGSWTPRASPVSVDLNAVAMSSPTSGWAVGNSCTIIRTTDGNTWMGAVSPLTCGVANNLRAIVLVSSSEGWAVGDADSSGATVLHGTSLDSTPSWTRLPVDQVATSLGLDSVTFATSGGNIWAVGKSGVAAFCLSNCGSPSSAVWSTTTSPNSFTLNSVWMVSDSDGWAVGNADPVAGVPTILRWDGGTFSWSRAPFVAPLVTPTDLFGVYLSGGSSGWAVGATTGPQASTLWYDGNTWSGKTVPACGCSLNSVYMVSDSNSWAVGSGGVIMHSTTSGGSFSTAPSTVADDLFSVFFDPSSGGQSGWAVGGDGINPPVIVHTSNGGPDAWPLVPNPAPAPVILKSVFFQDATHGWAAGTQGTILYWNGVSWTTVSVVGATGTFDLKGISVEGGTPAQDGWAVGLYTGGPDVGKPVTVHYDGTSWTVTSLTPAIPTAATLNGLALRTSTNGLAVGTNLGGVTLSLILHLDPPGGVQGGGGGGGTTSSTQTTSAATTSSTSETSSSAISSSTTSETSSTTQESSSTTGEATSQTSSAQPTTRSASSTTMVTTPTTQATSSSSVVTPVALPGIPGFPWESIIAGITVGLAMLSVVRKRRTPKAKPS